MVRTGLDFWGRVVRDPYTVLLAAAAALQLALGWSNSRIIHPTWAWVALGVFGVVCVAAVFARTLDSAAVRTIAPFGLVILAMLWRAASAPEVPGFGALCIIAVVWLGFYGTKTQVWVAVVGSVVGLVVAPLLAGSTITGDDLSHAALTGAVALLTGPVIRSLVERQQQSAELVSVLEPARLQLDAVLRAATGNLIIACDPDGIITDFNQGAERLLGYRGDQMVGTQFADLFDDANPSDELGDIEVQDRTCRAKDGRRVTVSISMSGMRNAAGTITGYVCIGTDVTASRNTMMTLTSQRQLYQSLVENLPLTTVGLLDSELRCVTLGGHWLRKIGAEPASFRGTPITDFFAPDDRERAGELYTRGLREQVIDQWQLADGRWYEFSALPMTGPDGEQLVLSLARDVTERQAELRESQRMHAALAVSESSFREAFEGAPIGMALTSVQDGPDEKFLRVNPAFAAILGRRPEDLVGRRVADVTHPEDVGMLPDLTVSGPAQPLRKRFMRPSGRSVWVDVSYTVVRDGNGEPTHVIKQIQDVHTIKESERALLDALEQQRAATARLRELDRIRTDLVGTISHELRTPLTSIHGYLELLADEALTDGQLGMLDVALRNTERLADLVDNLLVLVRLDSVDETVPAGSDDVDIASAVSAAVDTVRPEFVDRDQDLGVNLPVERAVVRGDFDQIDRVLVNLLSNASKYTPVGGHVDVDVALIGGAVRMTITDSGIGIPAEELPNLFTRFFRASTARANSISGNGLGLAIVKSIVERHGGEVDVESEPGVGSRFTVTLPALVGVEAEIVKNAKTVA